MRFRHGATSAWTTKARSLTRSALQCKTDGSTRFFTCLPQATTTAHQHHRQQQQPLQRTRYATMSSLQHTRRHCHTSALLQQASSTPTAADDVAGDRMQSAAFTLTADAVRAVDTAVTAWRRQVPHQDLSQLTDAASTSSSSLPSSSSPSSSLALVPVIVALLEIALQEADQTQRERHQLRAAHRTKRAQLHQRTTTTAKVDSDTPTTVDAIPSKTLYERLLFNPVSVRYFPAPWLFRRLMQVAAAFPTGHVCKDVVASRYTWDDFEAVLELLDVYTIVDGGLERREELTPDDATAMNEEDAPKQQQQDGEYVAALKEALRSRFWVLCPSVAPEVLSLAGTAGHPSRCASQRYLLCRREAASTIPPPLLPREPLMWRSPSICPAPDAYNQFNGWGSLPSVPRAEDVRAILAYIPVNWGNMGTLSIPSEVRKRHMRSSSPLLWFRRQPFYFEVRDMNGTVEIRRSVALHPDAHGLTLDEALTQIQLQIGEMSANHLVPLRPDGSVLPLVHSKADAATATAPSSQASTSSAKAAANADTDTAIPSSSPSSSAVVLSWADRATLKFLRRVCPPYFTTFSLLVQRATKKTIDEPLLVQLAQAWPADFELLRSRYSDVPLVRRRGAGVDPSRWREAFVRDLDSHPEDVEAILTLMNHLCATWDRPEYLFVRLTPQAQHMLGGFEGMMALLRRHPQVFQCGAHFVRRVNTSDPMRLQQPEPVPGEVLSRTYLCDENPYLTPREVAKVFYYVAPEGESFTPSSLVERASPAMQVTLPPRIITLLQLFPEWFACTETAPGVFSVHKIAQRQHEHRGSADAMAASATLTGDQAATNKDGEEEKVEEIEDHSWMRDAAAEEGTLLSHTVVARAASGDATSTHATGTGTSLSRAGVVEAVRVLVPAAGVESAQLLLWAPLPVQRAASQYYGGVVKLVEAEKSVFRVEEAPDASKRVFLRSTSSSSS